MELPVRLKVIADYIPAGSRVADIGTDHGLLPVYLIKNEIAPSVIASDLNKGPLEAAKKNVLKWALSDLIHLRLGNGLETLAEGEADAIIIAGMGGGTIRNILEASYSIAKSAKRLVLQPMGDAGPLRLWLVQKGWMIRDESAVKEDGMIYEIICAEPGVEEQKNLNIISVGPRLVEKKEPLLSEIIDGELKSIERILDSLKQSNSEAVKEKQAIMMKRKAFLEGILPCL